MEYKKKIENILPLLTFVENYDRGKFAGRLLKRFDYEFLVDRLPTFDPGKASLKNYHGYFRALEVWYRLNYGEWKAERSKKEDGEALDKLGNIFEKMSLGKKPEPDWVRQTRQDIRNARFKQQFGKAERLEAKLNAQGYSK